MDIDKIIYHMEQYEQAFCIDHNILILMETFTIFFTEEKELAYNADMVN